MQLIKSFGQFKGYSSNQIESTLNVQVDFDPIEGIVTDEEVKVWVINGERGTKTDLTAIFNELLSKQLEEIIESVDWREEYRLQRKNLKAA